MARFGGIPLDTAPAAAQPPASSSVPRRGRFGGIPLDAEQAPIDTAHPMNKNGDGSFDSQAEADAAAPLRSQAIEEVRGERSGVGRALGEAGRALLETAAKGPGVVGIGRQIGEHPYLVDLRRRLSGAVGTGFAEGVDLTVQSLATGTAAAKGGITGDWESLAEQIAEGAARKPRASPAMQGIQKRIGEVAEPYQEAWGDGEYLKSAKGQFKTIVAGAGEFIGDPVAFTEFAAQAMGTSSVPIAGMVVGGLAGSAVAPGPGSAVGAVGGGFVGSVALEFGLWVQEHAVEEIAKAGGNPSDPHAVAAWLQDPAVRNAMLKEAATKGLTHAAVGAVLDRLTVGMMKLKPTSTVGLTIQKVAGPTVQTLSEGAEEMISQTVATGDFDVADVALEMLGAPGAAAVQSGILQLAVNTAEEVKRGGMTPAQAEAVKELAARIENSEFTEASMLQEAIRALAPEAVPTSETAADPAIETGEAVDLATEVRPDTAVAPRERQPLPEIEEVQPLSSGALGQALADGARAVQAEVVAAAQQPEPTFLDTYPEDALPMERPEAAPAADAAAVAPVGDGTRTAPVEAATTEHLDPARAQVAEPTEAQKEAGNYKKGHVRVQGLDITIENPVGSERSGTDPDGAPWSVTMPADYGYVKRTTGADGEQMDVYIGPEPAAETVFVIDQVDAESKAFDEHKAMLGFPDQATALATYEAAFSDGRGAERMGDMRPMSVEEFKAWLKDGETTKPAGGALKGTSRDLGVPSDAGLFVELGSQRIEVPSMEEALSRYTEMVGAAEARSSFTDLENLSAEGYPTPLVTDAAGKVVGHIQPDGRIYEGRPEAWTRDTPILFGRPIPAGARDGIEAVKLFGEEVAPPGTMSEAEALKSAGEAADRLGLWLEEETLEAAAAEIRKGLDPEEAVVIAAERAAIEAEADAAADAANQGVRDEWQVPFDSGEEGGAGAVAEEAGRETATPEGTAAPEVEAARGEPAEDRGDEAEETGAEIDEITAAADDGLADYLRSKRESSADGSRRRSGSPLTPAEREAFLAGFDNRVAEIEGTDAPPYDVRHDKGARRNAFERGAQAVGFHVGQYRKAQKDETAVPKREADAPPVNPEKKKSPPARSEAAAPPTAKIADFGEKIEGARKDMSRRLADALGADVDIAAEPLSKVFPQPDYVKLAGEGVSMEALAYVAVMRDEIPPKPRKGWKLTRWVEKVKVLRGFALDMLSGEIAPAEVAAAIRKSSPDLTFIIDTGTVLAKLEPAMLPYAARWRVRSGTFSLFAGQRFDKPVKRYYVDSPKGRMDSVDGPTLDDIMGGAVNAITAGYRAYAAKPKTSASGVKISVYRDLGDETFFLGFKGRTGVIRLKTGFTTSLDARAWGSFNDAELREQIAGIRRGPTMRRAANRVRVGEDMREGDVSPEQFTEAFGFRGVQFGNYVEGGRRQADLNEAFDALMDLSLVLGIPSRAISLNGSLGLAFGARGKGGRAAAHFEPGEIVINLTKNAGPGSLAHEWLHAADNYFARQNVGAEGAIDDYITQGTTAVREQQMRPEVFEAWRAVRAAIAQGKFSKRSVAFDAARSKPYFGKIIEKAARAFERYIVDRLDAQGATNDYLVNIDTEGGAYPTAEEMLSDGIKESFDKLFATIETRETQQGVEMFAMGGEPVITLTGEEIGFTYAGPESMPSLRRAAQQWFDDNLRGQSVATRDGLEVSFSRGGRNKSTSGKGHRLLQAVPAIRAIIEQGEVVQQEPGNRTEQLDHIVIAAPVDIAGDRMTLAVSIHRYPGGTWQYDFSTWMGTGSPGVEGPGGSAKLAASPRPAAKSASGGINLVQWQDTFKDGMSIENLAARLRAVNLSDRVRLRLVEDIRSLADGRATGAKGRYVRGLIEIALNAESRGWVLDHEIVHALRDMGLIRKQEWETLSRAARADKARMEDIRKRYAKQGLTEEEMVEEAVADMFADWANDGFQDDVRGRSIFERIAEFFRALGRALTGASFRSAEDVFRAINRGLVGARRGDVGVPSLSAKLAAAYHGTPHDFDAFTTEAIGSGEGAQTYGWGLYFAGKKEVAEHYRQMLAGREHLTLDGIRFEAFGGPFDAAKAARNREVAASLGLTHPAAASIGWAALGRVAAEVQTDANLKLYSQKAVDPPALLRHYAWEKRELARDSRNSDIKSEFEVQAEIAETLADRVQLSKPGRLFKVDLTPSEDEWLLWDKSVSAQSRKVKDALQSLRSQLEASDTLDTYEEQLNADFDEWTGAEIVGKVLHRMAYDDAYPATDSLDAALANGEDRKAGSLYLKSLGIPGVKYLDAGSRGDGDGTFNYVVFDEADVAIVEKFSIPNAAERTDALDAYMNELLTEIESWARTTVSDFVRHSAPDDRAALSGNIEGAEDGAARVKAMAEFMGLTLQGRATPSNLAKAVKDSHRRLTRKIAELAEARAQEEDAALLESLIVEPREPGRPRRPRKDKETVAPKNLRAAIAGLRKAPKLPDPGDYRNYHRAFLHPYQIATKDHQFAEVFHWATEFGRLRNEGQVMLGAVLEPYMALSEKQRENVNKVLEIGRLEGTDYAADETITVKNDSKHGYSMLKPGESITLTDAERQGYLAARAMFDRALLMFKQQVLVEAGLGKPGDPRSAQGIRDFAQTENEELSRSERGALENAADLVEVIEKARRAGYVPFSRYGDYSITVTREGGVAWFGKVEKGIGDREKVAALRKRLEAQFPRAEGFIVQKTQFRPPVDTSSIQDIDFAVLDDMARRGGADQETIDSYDQAVRATWTAEGFRSHFIESRNTPGYEQDFTRSISDYIVGISGYLARRRAMGPIDQAVGAIATDKPMLRKYAREYKNYIFNPQEEYGQWRGAMFFAYLAGNVSSAALNLTQVPVFTLPFLTMVTNPVRAAGVLSKAGVLTAAMFRPQGRAEFLNFDVTKAPKRLQADIDALMREGTLVPMVTLETMGIAQGRKRFLRGLGKTQQRIMEAAGTMFTSAERFNRLSTAIAVLELGADPKVMARAEKAFATSNIWRNMADAQGKHRPIDLARFVIWETHFLMGKGNRSSALRGGWVVINQFKSFMANALQVQYRMATMYGPEGKKAFAMNMTMLFLAGGIFGLPGGDDLKDWYELLHAALARHDLDLEKEIQAAVVDLLGEEQGPWIAESIRRGALRQSGVDMSRRVGMGQILPAEPPRPSFSRMANASQLLDMLGIPGSTFATGLRALDHMIGGDWGTGLAELSRFALSAGGANVAKAAAMKSEGLRSRNRSLIMHPDDLHESDVALRAFGFQSTRLARRMEQDWMMTRADFAARELQSHYYKRLAMAIAGGDAEERKEIIDEIKAWNAEKPAYLRVNISNATLKQHVTREKLGRSRMKDIRGPGKSARERATIREIMPAN